MLELFVYYKLATGKEGEKDYSLTGCTKLMDIALNIIQKESLEIWNEKFEDSFKNVNNEGHPCIEKHNQLKKLTQEEYIKTLLKAKNLIKNYASKLSLDYDSLYLISSDSDIKDLTYQIILKSKSTKEIEDLIEKYSKDNNANKDKVAIVINELCNRYYYGDRIEKNYQEAFKGWKMVSEYSNDARYMLGICYKEGTGIEENKKKAYEIFYEFMNKDFRASYQVALMNLRGIGVSQNYIKALEIFNKLKGHVPYDLDKLIESYIGEMYFYGLGVNQNKEKGLELLENAWNSGIGLNYQKIKKVLKDYYNIKN